MPFKVGEKSFDTPEALHAFAVEQAQDVTRLTQDVADGKEREQELQSKVDESEQKLAEFADNAARERVESEIDSLVEEGRVPPKMRDKFVKLALALDADEKHEFTVKDGDDEKIESGTLRETLLSMLGDGTAIDFTEKSETGDEQKLDDKNDDNDDDRPSRSDFERDRKAVIDDDNDDD